MQPHTTMMLRCYGRTQRRLAIQKQHAHSDTHHYMRSALLLVARVNNPVLRHIIGLILGTTAPAIMAHGRDTNKHQTSESMPPCEFVGVVCWQHELWRGLSDQEYNTRLPSRSWTRTHAMEIYQLDPINLSPWRALAAKGYVRK